MPYTEIHFTIAPADPGSEILVAQLAEIGFEGFEETETGVKAYIRKVEFDKVRVLNLDILHREEFLTAYSIREVEEENWNSIWESSYEPVCILDEVYIRASFHPERAGMKHDVVIDPKMSFGTAHHETTALMIEQILQEDLTGRHVLDMGCGTAVLAILAEKRGARRVVAIDNDPNAVENARENTRKNNCRDVSVLLGNANDISGPFDVILANINKNILLRDLKTYASQMKTRGVVLLSGFYRSDLDDLLMQGEESGLAYHRAISKNNWTVARFFKK